MVAAGPLLQVFQSMLLLLPLLLLLPHLLQLPVGHRPIVHCANERLHPLPSQGGVRRQRANRS